MAVWCYERKRTEILFGYAMRRKETEAVRTESGYENVEGKIDRAGRPMKGWMETVLKNVQGKIMLCE